MYYQSKYLKYKQKYILTKKLQQGGNNYYLHNRPFGDPVRKTFLRIEPHKDSSFYNEFLSDNESVQVININLEYGLIEKNGIRGWCNMKYLMKLPEISNFTSHTPHPPHPPFHTPFHTPHPPFHAPFHAPFHVPSHAPHAQFHAPSHAPHAQFHAPPHAQFHAPRAQFHAPRTPHVPSHASNYGCAHSICNTNMGIKGVGAIIVIESNHTKYVIFGREKNGEYSNTYNVVGGKMDKPNECPLVAIYREIAEEIKLLPIQIDWNLFDAIFKQKGNFITERKRDTLLFFGKYNTPDANRTCQELNNLIDRDNKNPFALDDQKEMYDIKLFDINSRAIDGNIYPVSKYAQSILTRYAHIINSL